MFVCPRRRNDERSCLEVRCQDRSYGLYNLRLSKQEVQWEFLWLVFIADWVQSQADHVYIERSLVGAIRSPTFIELNYKH